MVTTRPGADELYGALPPLPPALRAALDGGADDLGHSLARTLAWVQAVGPLVPLPRHGTAVRWRFLAETAARDVAAARMLEPHLDALAILAEARAAGADVFEGDGTWGVFAAEGGDRPVRAEQTADGGWRLTGTKPWCSLAAHLDHALVTAWVGEDRGLFAIDLRAPGVRAHEGPWHARGLSRIVSAPIDLDAVPARAVGEPGWYLRRPGFADGGMGVAAVWWGGALPLVEALVAVANRPGADQLSTVFAGRADAAAWTASVILSDAARAVDAAAAAGRSADDAKILAARVRAVVAAGTREILGLEARALGPGPVTISESHARRVADLELYVRQDHADRDLARLGRLRAAREASA